MIPMMTLTPPDNADVEPNSIRVGVTMSSESVDTMSSEGVDTLLSQTPTKLLSVLALDVSS
jgi:hypothetical protein